MSHQFPAVCGVVFEVTTGEGVDVESIVVEATVELEVRTGLEVELAIEVDVVQETRPVDASSVQARMAQMIALFKDTSFY